MKIIILFFCVLSTIFSGCTSDPTIEESPTNKPDDSRSGILFESSFESQEDFALFRGHGHGISGEVPPGAGDSSLLIAGGCVGYHWTLALGPYSEDKLVTISFQAKSSEDWECGFISLCSPYSGICEPITIESSGTWREYKSAEPLLVSANDSLKLYGMSGGLAACLTYVDMLIVEEI